MCMINEPHAITAETAGFFFRDDVTYLAHNRVSSFPSLAKGQKNVKEPLVCFLFFVPGQLRSHSPPFFSPRSMFVRFSAAFLFATRQIVTAKNYVNRVGV